MGGTEELYQAFSDFITEDAENIISDEDNNELQFNQKVSIRIPKERDRILIDVLSVHKIRKVCQEAKKEKFSYAELFLGISSLLLGAFLGAIMSRIPYELTFLSVLFYTVCPLGGVGFGVAYWFYRKKDIADIKYLAEKIEEYIEDFDETGSERKDYEY